MVERLESQCARLPEPNPAERLSTMSKQSKSRPAKSGSKLKEVAGAAFVLIIVAFVAWIWSRSGKAVPGVEEKARHAEVKQNPQMPSAARTAALSNAPKSDG